MGRIFEISDKKGRIVYLSDERWRHILHEHPKLTGGIEHIKETISASLFIRQSANAEDVHYYHRWHKEWRRYLFVAVKYLNGLGYVITAFYMRVIKK